MGEVAHAGVGEPDGSVEEGSRFCRRPGNVDEAGFFRQAPGEGRFFPLPVRRRVDDPGASGETEARSSGKVARGDAGHAGLDGFHETAHHQHGGRQTVRVGVFP